MPELSRSKLHFMKVRVVEVHGNGIRVTLLDDGRQGFVRRREVSWERRISASPQDPQPGDILDAVILEQTRGGTLLLSLCQTTDPWQVAINDKKYRINQVVDGEVVNVRQLGAFVQIEPGIDSFVPISSVPILRGQSIEDVLWIGDKISAHIRSIDADQHKMELSIIRRIQEFDRFDDFERRRSQFAYFSIDNHPRSLRSARTVNVVENQDIFVRIPQQRISRLERILIIDNEYEWLHLLSKGLQDHFQGEGDLEIDGVTNGQEALRKLQDGIPYSLILVDQQLDGENGFSVAQEIRRRYPNLPILLTTVIWMNDDRLLSQNEFPFSHKNLEELIQHIDDLRSGIHYFVRRISSTNGNSISEQLGSAALANREFAEVSFDILARLARRSKVSNCLLVEIDVERQVAAIVASYPKIEAGQASQVQDGLYFSPVQNVIIERQEVRYEHIKLESDTRFKNFFPTLDFQSCLGIPIRIPGQEIRYGLFLLDRHPDRFRPELDNQIDSPYFNGQMAAYSLVVAVERASLIEALRHYGERYAHGQLLGDLIHETYNKANALSTNLSSLKEIYASRPLEDLAKLEKTWDEKMVQAIDRIIKNQAELRELVDAYMRQAKNEYEEVDVNQVIDGVARQLVQTAKRMGAALFLALDKDLPKVYALRSSLQQVVLNLMLNAIQMIALQKEAMAVIAEQNFKRPLLQNGLVIVQTRYSPQAGNCPVEIRVIDSGPGVHWRDRERIFQPGFSKRGGAGLGLYISRNLVERMDGRLYLLDSILFVGSAFIVELAQYSDSKEQP